jgi:hypothetical protein
LAQVFISFIHEEKTVAVAVQQLLQSRLATRDVFLSADHWQVFAGEIWLDRIRAELMSAKVVILLMSAESVKRPWVNFEAGAAWLTDKALLPVCFGGMTRDRLPKPYSGIQALDLRTEFYYLVASVAHHLAMLPPPPSWEGEEVRALMAALDELERISSADPA